LLLDVAVLLEGVEGELHSFRNFFLSAYMSAHVLACATEGTRSLLGRTLARVLLAITAGFLLRERRRSPALSSDLVQLLGVGVSHHAAEEIGFGELRLSFFFSVVFPAILVVAFGAFVLGFAALRVL